MFKVSCFSEINLYWYENRKKKERMKKYKQKRKTKEEKKASE